MPTDEAWMHRAVELASRCAEHGDVPIGAVLVREDREIGAAGNERELRGDPTAHAEILAIREAASAGRGWRLDGGTLYVTLEPCAMCAGAIVLARLDRVVFGAADPKAGFAGSLGNLVQDPRLNHEATLVPGVLGEECAELLRAFFRERRSR
ncbi:MAG: nucleoside deaminase [Actinobacteria bacterium]|nr:MAG: nucleoside deaminase [Actinomycetota bacterium]